MFSSTHYFPAGQMVYTVRQRCGRQLAIEAPTDADVVSTVPESATPAALGYAQQVCLNRSTNTRTSSRIFSSLYLFLSFSVRTSLYRGSVQESLCRTHIYSTKYALEAAGGRQKVWSFVRQLCWETRGADRRLHCQRKHHLPHYKTAKGSWCN